MRWAIWARSDLRSEHDREHGTARAGPWSSESTRGAAGGRRSGWVRRGVGAEAAIFGRGRERSTWSSSSHSRSDGSLPGPNRTEGVSPDRTADPGDGHPERRREAPGHPRRSDDLHNRHPDEPDASSDRPAVADAVSNDDSSERETPSARGLVLPADVWLAYGIGAVIVGILAVRWSSGMISVPVAIVALVVATMTVCFHRRR
jgi:hypothetical protein